MFRIRLLTAFALATAVCPTALAAGEDDAAIDALQAEVAALRADLAAVRNFHDRDWLTEQRSNEIRALVCDLLTDADTRTSLLQDGATAGWSNGFFITNPDQTFKLIVNGQLQFRGIYNRQNDGPADDDRWGFESTRTKLIFSGYAVNPRWVYRIEADFDRDGGSFAIDDAYIGHVLGESGWTLLAGQFKVPMLREELVDSRSQQAVERSLVNEEFTAGRTQGVAADYRNEWLHFTAGVTDGHPATGGFNTPALTYDTEISLTARGEVLLAGEWGQFGDLPSWKGEVPGALLGGAVHYQVGEYDTAADELEVFQWTLDASYENNGLSLLAYIVGRHLDSDAIDLDQYGVVVQAGLFLTDQWEIFGRYEWGDDDFSGDDLSLVTVGATRYFARHQLKWTTDAGYGIEPVAATWGSGFIGSGGDVAGWRTDSADQDGQLVIRSQLQLLF